MRAQMRKAKKEKGILIRMAEGKKPTKLEQNFLDRRNKQKGKGK